jgi:phenylalanyl-tRNA synthetase beta chain
MKISFNWLKNYVSSEIQIDEIAKILTDTGLEVEGVEKIEAVQGGLEGVVIGKVLTCEKHPDADKLKVTTVDIGTEILQIVCGADNVAAGQKVVVATVGCTLYPKPDEAFKIKAAKIRGVESFGMLCAEDELGLGTSHAGILVLPENIETGSSAASYFDLEDDFQIEIGLTPNRSDAMGHIGVARDLVAFLNFHQQKNASIVWPETHELKAENANSPILVNDVPLLFEAHLEKRFDSIVFIQVDKDVQIKRLKKRNPEMSEKEILDRINSQMSQEEKISKSNIVIANNSSLQEFKAAISTLIKNFLN